MGVFLINPYKNSECFSLFFGKAVRLGVELFAYRCANRMLYSENLGLRSAKQQLKAETWLWVVPFLSLLLDLFLKHCCSCSELAWSNVSPAGSWGDKGDVCSSLVRVLTVASPQCCCDKRTWFSKLKAV